MILIDRDIPPSCAECILTTDYWYDCPCGDQDELLHDDDRRDDCPLIEIVRCKDCFYANKSLICSIHVRPMTPEGFCNYGRRK